MATLQKVKTPTKAPKETIYMCKGKKCSRYNQKNLSFLQKELAENDLEPFIKFKKMKCQKMCKHAPVYYFKKKDTHKKEVTIKKIKKWLDKWRQKIKIYQALASHK